jgi:hypothetical protein
MKLPAVNMVRMYGFDFQRGVHEFHVLFKSIVHAGFSPERPSCRTHLFSPVLASRTTEKDDIVLCELNNEGVVEKLSKTAQSRI